MKRYIFFLLVVSFLFSLSSCADEVQIIDKPIKFSDKRIELTKDYIKKHYNLDVDNIEIEPKIIVLHWTAVDNFDSCFAIFDKETLKNSRPDLKNASDVNVAIQFLIDQDGSIYKLMPDNWMARHVIGLNYSAIGFENVGGQNNIDNLTDAQVDADVKLIRYLKKKYPSIEYLIGHHEYREFEGHKLWLETDDNYRTKKYDPGDRFMKLVRNRVKDLDLKGVEEIRKEISNQ